MHSTEIVTITINKQKFVVERKRREVMDSELDWPDFSLVLNDIFPFVCPSGHPIWVNCTSVNKLLFSLKLFYFHTPSHIYYSVRLFKKNIKYWNFNNSIKSWLVVSRQDFPFSFGKLFEFKWAYLVPSSEQGDNVSIRTLWFKNSWIILNWTLH